VGRPTPALNLTTSVVFTGTAGTNGLAAFECKLDTGEYLPCASPWPVTDLSVGEHIFLVRSIDSQGFVDESPASYSWTVNASAPTITRSPTVTTTARTATFEFSGGSNFQCSVDGAAFTPCASGQSYTGLADGEHNFLVRSSSGAAVRFVWTVVNTAPVAASQQMTTTAATPLAGTPPMPVACTSRDVFGAIFDVGRVSMRRNGDSVVNRPAVVDCGA